MVRSVLQYCNCNWGDYRFKNKGCSSTHSHHRCHSDWVSVDSGVTSWVIVSDCSCPQRKNHFGFYLDYGNSQAWNYYCYSHLNLLAACCLIEPIDCYESLWPLTHYQDFQVDAEMELHTTVSCLVFVVETINWSYDCCYYLSLLWLYSRLKVWWLVCSTCFGSHSVLSYSHFQMDWLNNSNLNHHVLIAVAKEHRRSRCQVNARDC